MHAGQRQLSITAGEVTNGRLGVLIVILHKHCTGFHFHNPYVCKICFAKTTTGYCYLQLRSSTCTGSEKLSGAVWDHSVVKRRCSAFLAFLASMLQEEGKEGRRNRELRELNSSGAGWGRGRLPPCCSDGRCMQVLGVLFSLLLQEPVEGSTTAGEGRAWECCRKSACL